MMGIGIMAVVRIERTQRIAVPLAEDLVRTQISGNTQMLHIRKGVRLKWRSALVNEFIFWPWLIETTILGGTHPRCDVRISICINMPKGKVSAK